MSKETEVSYFNPPSSDLINYTQVKGKTIVIKYGGAALEQRALTEPTIRDIVSLQQVGAKVVVVHGGSRQLDKRMKKIGQQIKNEDGLRYTSSETIKEAKVIFNEINATLVRLLQNMGATAIGLSGDESGLIKAQLKSFETYGYVGDVKSVDIEKLGSIMAQGEIPIISTLGKADDGQVLNINADAAACAVASSLHADQFILLTDVEGILQDSGDPSSLISTIDDDGIESLLKEHIVVKGMVHKLKACREAIRKGVPVVRILSAQHPHALITAITGDSHYGTQVVGGKSHSLSAK